MKVNSADQFYSTYNHWDNFYSIDYPSKGDVETTPDENRGNDTVRFDNHPGFGAGVARNQGDLPNSWSACTNKTFSKTVYTPSNPQCNPYSYYDPDCYSTQTRTYHFCHNGNDAYSNEYNKMENTWN